MARCLSTLLVPFGLQSPGKKGIGFKSVFKITDTPIIHSAGWHFRFNARLKLERVNIKEPVWIKRRKGMFFTGNVSLWGQELGYIVPEIVPEEDMKFPGWTTEIRLPFKPELGNEEKAVLEQDFRALDGTLLLNLNKLRPGFLLLLLGLFLGGCIIASKAWMLDDWW